MKKLAIMLINFYQKAISPHKNPCCKYNPSCSEYMKRAIEKNGFKGFIQGILRLLKCNPFSKGGYDPVK